MNRNSSILIPDQSIIIPTEADGMSMSAAPISRRNLIQRGGALAMAAPMGIVASSALLSTPAHAATLVVDAKRKVATYSKTMSGESIKFNVYDTTTAGRFVIVMNNLTTGKNGIIYRDNSTTRVFNAGSYANPSGVYRRYTLTSEIGSISSGLLDSDIDGGRRLSTVSWNNPTGSSITSQGDLSPSSDALTLFWETYRTSGLVTYSGAIIQKVTSSGTAGFTQILRFSGSNHNTFVNKRTAYTNAVNSLNAANGRYRATLVVAGVAGFAGLVGTVFSAGTTAALLGGALATLAGNGVLNGQQIIDSGAVVASTWHDMLSWVESKTGEDLVR